MIGIPLRRNILRLNQKKSTMRKTLLLIIILVLWISVPAQETDKPKVLTGFSGGMMLHTGYLFGEMPEIGYTAKGAPFGLGGALRLHLGQHWMIGGEGYVSTLHQLHNGSYVKYGWGGVLGEFYWTFNRITPFVGLTVGGGRQTTFLLFDGDSHDWQQEGSAVFHKQGFCALTPFIGCEFAVARVLHIIVKADWMNAFSRQALLTPHGPRFYVGLMFHH